MVVLGVVSVVVDWSLQLVSVVVVVVVVIVTDAIFQNCGSKSCRDKVECQAMEFIRNEDVEDEDIRNKGGSKENPHQTGMNQVAASPDPSN